jgi:integrase
MKATYKIIYNRKKNLNKLGEALIQIVVYIPKMGRKYLSTGIHIKPDEWDAKNKKIKKKNPNYTSINKLLNDTIRGIEEYEYKIISENKLFSFAELEKYITHKNTATSSLIDFISNEINLEQVLEKKTRKEHKYTLVILKKFRANLRFDEANYQFAQEFDNWMRTIKKLSQNTIHKHHAHIRRFLNIATQKEVYDASKNTYNKFKSKKVESDRKNLTPEQVDSLEQLKIPEEHVELKNARDLFLFSCYCGMRYSDVQALKLENVRKDISGNISIRFQMEKVDRFIELPLHNLFDGKPELILQRYLTPINEKIFPQYTNQHINRLLKVLAISAKINSRLTFHIARHTFGTFLAEKTCNPYLIMDLMGHHDIKTSMIYIHHSQERINRQLKNINWTLVIPEKGAGGNS